MAYDPEFFREYVSGQASEMRPMVNLLAQTFAILVAGIFLWRLSVIFQKKRNNRKRTIFNDSRFDSWRKS